MDEQKKEGKEGCCASHGSCCGGKWIAGLILLLVGAAAGYFLGRCCGSKHAKMCAAPGAMSAPATPGAEVPPPAK